MSERVHAASAPLELIDILPAANILGECVLWRGAEQTLWWTDIQSQQLYCYDWRQRRLQHFATPERVTAFGFVAGDTRLITAFASGIALYDPTQQSNGQSSIEWLARPKFAAPGLRCNDGRVDRRGRFWFGTMVEDASSQARGSLYSLTHSRATGAQLREHLGGVRIANGLCFSPDGALVYFTDSSTQRIHAHPLKEPAGTIGSACLLAQTASGTEPDGATVDAQGYVWSAHWGGGCVVRYAPNGSIDQVLKVPASQPTCVCFGGPQLDLLFVSSARQGLSSTALAEQPHAGDVFVYRTPYRGLPEGEFQLQQSLEN